MFMKMLNNKKLRRQTVAIYTIGLVLIGACTSQAAFAIGTDAGREILNTAQATFSVAGVVQTPVVSNSTQTFVDELIDVVVVSDDAGAVGVSSSQTNAVLQFSVTNTGNGTESMRLIADTAVGGDDFNPALNQIYLEDNGVPGLQTGAGGDTPYLSGSGDPTMIEDEVLIVYIDSAIVGGPAQNDEGAVALRAVANTIVSNAGTDDPADALFPAVGTSYAGAGDLNETGSGNVTAVVGTSHDLSNLLIRAQGRYRVSAAVVSINKSAVAVSDPFGGITLVPGTIITYQIDVLISGTDSAESLAVTDVIPAQLEYQPGTLAVSALPAGEEVDDDFAPSGSDNTGFVAGTQTITVNLGTVAAGTPVITITFDAAIR